MLPRQKLEGLKRRNAELEQLLCEPSVLADPKRLNALNRERVEISPVVEAFGRYQAFHLQNYAHVVTITFDPVWDMDSAFAETINNFR